MSAKNMWMVRAESGGILFEDFKEKSVVAIGWDKVGDLSKLRSRKAVNDKVSQFWPDYSSYQVSSAGGQLFRFANEIKPGDQVVTYDPSRRVYLVGETSGNYHYNNSIISGYPHVIDVKWQGEVSRDRLTISTKNSLGSISTLFMASAEASEDIGRALRGEAAAKPSEAVEQESEVELLKDIQARAVEFIKDQVNSLGWDEMQQLVAGLLRSMGYKTRVSPSGPDRGKDIVASPDGFGFESPRIVVEVKHRTATMGAPEIRGFLGGRHKDDKGLYVSTGGFTKDARYEAERATIPLTLMDIDDLVLAILERYEHMDIETQRILPLKKLYWPA